MNNRMKGQFLGEGSIVLLGACFIGRGLQVDFTLPNGVEVNFSFVTNLAPDLNGLDLIYFISLIAVLLTLLTLNSMKMDRRRPTPKLEFPTEINLE